MTNYEKGLELKNAVDFAERSCWQCNPAHEHLKAVGQKSEFRKARV